jgi:OOP family OmpA-OmpF porin
MRHIRQSVITGISAILCAAFLLACSDSETMRDEMEKKGFVTLHINFETAKSDIKPESQHIIDQVVDLLMEDESLRVSIEGHTDDVGSAASNKTLSENRAKSVMNAIVAKGVDRSRLSTKGWGQEKPIADNKTADGRAKNRRVEIVKK